MSNELNNNLMILEAEKERAELRLKEQIKSIRNALESLEYKLNNNQSLYASDGIQGNGVYLDAYLSKLVAYEDAIKRFKAHLESDKKGSE
ncbi:hypothetical protein MOC02_07900 [Bacillus inaquosorum]|uniref:hypothetical protein n=1 Tax=Bacillus inaquosorum TaxID=483913 RepID=UPI0022812D97|nr:hypothetical protein [Bacillus inaquosorum]MCY7767097.1 hypothetical protein [Bacillus inaquosorum]MCY8083220.1 hypothetical protein [Bacillus inaquosorum]MCY8175856.1 hypothetical protein [Bacillus inaquosorum]MCY9084383.1 hypothetical protein [Bacillus inaquosorum]MCY9273445.1 hypothetical protein [Bacillus inaquosorum]